MGIEIGAIAELWHVIGMGAGGGGTCTTKYFQSRVVASY